MFRNAKDPFAAEDRVHPGMWLRDHVRVLKEALQFISLRPGTSILVWLLVGIALALPAGLYLLQRNLADVSAAWDGRPGLSIYMKLDASEAAVQELARRLEDQRGVASVVTTLPAEALIEFQSHTGLGDALDMLSGNPLPASIRVLLDSKARTSDLEIIAGAASGEPAVEEVVVEKTWLARIQDLTAIVSRLSLVLAILFGVGAVLVTASSIRLAIESRLEELKVQKLVGATNAQIRRPFLYFGAIYGAGGALVSLMLIAAALMVIESPLTSLFSSYGANLDLIGFSPSFLGFMLGLGAFLGICGALVSSGRRVREIEIQ